MDICAKFQLSSSKFAKSVGRYILINFSLSLQFIIRLSGDLQMLTTFQITRPYFIYFRSHNHMTDETDKERSLTFFWN